MDLIITLLLMIIAAAMFTGRPLKIELKLKQPTALQEVPKDPQEAEDEKQQQQAYNNVIQAVNDFMGVDNDEEE